MTVYYSNNQLKIEDVFISDLVQEYKTPFYVYSKKTLIEEYIKLKKTLNQNIFYSIKANSNQSIISILKNLGAGADVVSGEELKRALAAQVDPKKIIFEGVGKSKEDIILAIKSNIRQINIESLEEIPLINNIAKTLNLKTKIGIRINPNINAKTHDKISTGRSSDKFGISINDLLNVIDKIHESKNILFVGISCHIGSQIFSLDIYEKTFSKIKEVIKLFHDNNLSIHHLNLGGGMGFDPASNRIFDLDKFSKIINQYFKNETYELSIEPGRYLTAKSGTLITKILMVKSSSNNNFIIVDAGMNTFIRPALYNAVHNILPNIKNKEDTNYIVAGPICESSDIFVKNIKLPKQSIDDILAIQDVGAYGSTMSSNYNSKVLPAEVMVMNNQHETIRPHQRIDTLIANDKIPKWLNESY